jgi:hypothetical protein
MAELLEIDIMEIKSQAEDTRKYMSGAIRLVTNYIEQYNAILEKFGKKGFNEKDFEEEEEQFHIMRTFEQAMCAARSRGGSIDEGNMIYLTQLGINGASAQKDVFEYLVEEGKIISTGKDPSHEMYLQFLQDMAKKYKGNAQAYAKSRGMMVLTDTALIREGDKRQYRSV